MGGVPSASALPGASGCAGGRHSRREKGGGCLRVLATLPLEEAPKSQPLTPNCLVVSLPCVAIASDDQSALISAVIAALGVVVWEEAEAGGALAWPREEGGR